MRMKFQKEWFISYSTKVIMLVETLFIFVIAFVPSAHGEAAGLCWCYRHISCSQATWASLPNSVCNGTRQSPININTLAVQSNASLTPFTFTGFDSTSAMTSINNMDNTVKVLLQMGLMNVSGGGLSSTYNALQFHLHWGNGSDVPGSEHTVDGTRFPMELHLVTIKSAYNGNTTLALQDSEGLAAFGFFIDAKNDSNLPAGWKTLTSYLFNITESGQGMKMKPGFSLDDLLMGVDRGQYYRYLGSLTTPACNEAVVWTVFKESVRVSKNLINLFSSTVQLPSNVLMTNTFRSTQSSSGRVVTTQVSASSPLKANLTPLLLSLGLLHVLLRK